jgi:quercetin dioxygenase-like cupin family protein
VQFMLNRRKFLEAGIAGALFSLLSNGASGADVMRKQVFKRDLPNLNLDGWEVTALEIAFPPGVVPAKHRHPGFVLGYVLAGDFRFRMEGEQERIVHAGERFFESPDKIHVLSASADQSEPAKILALVFGEKGKAVSAPA